MPECVSYIMGSACSMMIFFLKSGASRTKLSYSPPSPAVLMPFFAWSVVSFAISSGVSCLPSQSLPSPSLETLLIMIL